MTWATPSGGGGVTGPTAGLVMISPGTTGAATGLPVSQSFAADTIPESNSSGQIPSGTISPVNGYTLTDGTTISVANAVGAGAVWSLTITGTPAGTHTIGNPLTLVAQQVFTFVITENSTGGYTPAWGSEYNFGGNTLSFNTAPNAVNIVSFVATSTTNLQYQSSSTPAPPTALSWAPGQNLAAATTGIGLFTAASTARTIETVTCRPDTAAGGTATIDVWIAPSGTALSSGTKVTTTSCNAAGTAATNQTGLASAPVAVPVGDTVGIVAAGAGFTSSPVGAGSISIGW